MNKRTQLARERIWIVIDAWKAGRHDEAIAMLLAMSRDNAPDAAYRPYNLSEQEFVARWGAQCQEGVQEMLPTVNLLRAIAREIEARAAEAARSGKGDEARALLNALKRCGAANRGPEVVLLCDSVGAKLEQMADKGLAGLDAAPAGPGTTSPAP